jgi:hypothetical protein
MSFFTPNIQLEGRVVRGITACVFCAAAVVALRLSRRLSLLLFVSALLAFYEALRGWCLLRACGVKTKV